MGWSSCTLQQHNTTQRELKRGRWVQDHQNLEAEPQPDVHVSVRQVLKVVSSDTLVGVGREDGPAVTQTPQALHSDAFPRVQQVSIQVLEGTQSH